MLCIVSDTLRILSYSKRYHSNIFRLTEACSETHVSLAYSQLCLISNPSIFRRHIQNPVKLHRGIFRALSQSEQFIQPSSEPCVILAYMQICYPSMLAILEYSEHFYNCSRVQNSLILTKIGKLSVNQGIQNRSTLTILEYSEH